MKRITSFLISCCMLTGILPNIVFASEDPVMVIDADTVVNTVSGQLYGVSTDWSITAPAVEVDASSLTVSANPNMVKAMNEYKLPLVRIGEGATTSFNWKKAIGNYSDRPEQSLWGVKGKVAAGPIEYVKVFEQIDPEVSFSFTVDVINQTAQDAADFAEFLVGDDTTEWGRKRAEYGHQAPINVKLYELGNEPDYGQSAITKEEYIQRCKDFISAIKAADPDAVFAAATDTEVYSSFLPAGSGTWDSQAAWHRAILADSELMANVSYLSVHAYYGMNDSCMGNLISAIESDISNSDHKNTKIYLSEHALSYYDTNGDGVNDTDPSSMGGTIETAFTLQRLMAHSKVDMATYHGILSSVWGNIWRADTGEMQLNAIGELFKLFKEYGVGELLASSYSGYSASSDSSSYGVAVKDGSGNIDLIFTNNTAAAKTVDVSFEDSAEYTIANETKIVSTSDRSAKITYESNGIKINRYEYDRTSVFDQYTMPAYSVCAVRLTPKADAEQEEDVSFAADLDNVQNYMMPDGWKNMSGRMLSYVWDGSLTVKSGEWYEPQYVAIGGLSGMKKEGLTIEADITLLEQNENARSNGARNKAGFAFISGAGYSTGGLLTFYDQVEFSESGNDGLTQASVDFEEGKEFSSKNTVNLKLVFTEAAKGLDMYVNGTKYTYYNKSSTNTADGVPCLMVQAATVRFDNIKVTGERTEKAVNDEQREGRTAFEYTENFDNVDGRLPERWTLYSKDISKTTAEVSNGVLNLTNTNWYGDEWLLFELEDVARNGLTMECDITYAQNTSTGGFENSKAGLAYAASVEDGTVTGDYVTLLTDISDPTCQQISMGGTKNDDSAWNKSLSDTNIAAAVNNNNDRPMHLKINFNNDTQGAVIYIDGVQVRWNRSDVYSDKYVTSGKIGLYIRNANVKIDNVKVTGTRPRVLPEKAYLNLDEKMTFDDGQRLSFTLDAGVPDEMKAGSCAVVAAVYSADDRLLTAKILDLDISSIKDYHGTITIDDVRSGSDADELKVFFWDMDNCSPLTPAVSRQFSEGYAGVG